MRKLFKEILNIDDKFMFGVYSLSLVTELCHFYAIWKTDYPLGANVFTDLNAFSGGVIIMLVSLLVSLRLRRKGSFARSHLLLALIIAQAFVIALDTAFSLLYRDFWVTGYLFLLLELLFMAAYLRRYFFLKKARVMILRDIEMTEAQNNEQ